MPPLDVLIITALHDELKAVLALGERHRAGWKDERDPAGFIYHSREFPIAGGDELRVAAAWAGAMGEAAAADRSRSLIDHLQPLSLAMCGICAGRRGDVFLGDVIVADRVFSYDHGKLFASVSNGQRVEELFHDIETYNLEKAWAMDAAYFAPEKEWQDLLRASRPLSLSSQRGWLLRSLYAHQAEGVIPPQSHPERGMRCPDWSKAIASLIKERLIILKKGQAEVTAKGRQVVLDERVLYVDGAPPDPPFQVHVGPVATGKAVRQDTDLFKRLAKFERKVLGVEMEGAAIGYVAERSGIPSIVAKAVSDFGDNEKEDGFRQFACRASAEFLLAFLLRHPPRSLKRNLQLRVSGDEVKALPQQVAAEVLNALLKKGMTLSVPKGGPSKSLFYCETQAGRRIIGAALNNSGLIAYVGPSELVKVIDINRKREYEARALDIGNQFIRFAILDSDTEGLTPSYLRQIEAFDKNWDKTSWIAFDRDGQPINLKLEHISVLMRIATDNGEVFLKDVMIAGSDFGDGQLLGGPVLSETNELIGFAIAGSTLNPENKRFVVIWPWVSLDAALREARVSDKLS